GAVLGRAVLADACISFIGLKLGLVTGQGPAHCGDLYFDDLAVPREVYADDSPLALCITDKLRTDCLPRRTRTAHKGLHGHVHCLGGDHGTAGAIRIAAEAALRSGAGLVSVSTQPNAANSLVQACPELMASGFVPDAVLHQHASSADLLLLGPGLGQRDWGQQLWGQALALNKPMLVDADGLNLLAQNPMHRDNWVLTPHPGEAARLLGCDTRQVQADRPAAVRALQTKYGGVIVLKGAGSLVLGPDGQLHVCRQGNPGMAVGGMGDLLAGIITGLWAQGIDMTVAARLGVYLHAVAADRAAADLGERGLLPTDLFAYLRALLNP
ncbi:MAG: NAD(P)H-hydrate dehydratase, partial [Nevskiales bacterium]